MKIWQKIKEFIKSIRIKKIEAPREIEENADKTEKNLHTIKENLLYEQNVNKKELTEKQKLEEILQTVGCSKQSIESILEIENINIQNLRKNLYTLNNLKYSNIELTIIITQNEELITMENSILEKQIEQLIKHFGNDLNQVQFVFWLNIALLNNLSLK